MINDNQEKSKAILDAEEAIKKAKAQLKNARNKENAERRKKENHHKYLMGGIIVKYFPECYQFEESELNRILSVAIKTRECQQMISTIKKENAGYGNNIETEGEADEE